jgi:hypothetical protein
MAERFDPAIENDVRRALQRVAPPQEFRNHLRENLRAAAEYRESEVARTGAGWLLGAVIIGAVLGFAVIMLHARRLR